MEESISISICSPSSDLLKGDLKSSELVNKFNVLLWSTNFLMTLLNHLQIISDHPLSEFWYFNRTFKCIRELK